jgi:hypothetical protein
MNAAGLARPRLDLFGPKFKDHPAKSGTKIGFSKTFSMRPDKNGLKMGCENVNLFLSEP